MNSIDGLIERLLKNRVLLHVLYWVGVFVLFCLFGLGYGQPLIVSFFLKLTVFPIQIIASYTFIYWQLPQLFKRNYAVFFILSIGLTLPFYFLVHINYDLGIGSYLISWHEPHSLYTILTDLEFYFRYTVDVYLVVFVTGTIKFIKDHLVAKEVMENLESEMMKVEYNILQSKLKPNFVLNALALIKKQSIEGSENTPKTIANLSTVLDDILYQSQKESRNLLTEKERLDAYLELYVPSSKSINEASLETQIRQDSLVIKPLVLHKLVSEIFEQIEMSEEKGLNINLLLLNEGLSCILQMTFSPSPTIAFDFKALKKYLDIVYPDKYQIEEMNHQDFKDIQFIIEL